MTRLLVWRHGRTSWNATRRLQGQSDIDLDDVGRAQADAAAVLLAAAGPDSIVSSDLGRARRTAAPLAARTGLPVRIDPRLRERAYGDWEGLTGTEIRTRFPAAYRRWRAGRSVSAHGVEDLSDLAKRAGEALTEAAASVPGGTVVVVAHGGAAKLGVGALLGWSEDTLLRLEGLDNCHWSELRSDESGWRLVAHNLGPGPIQPPREPRDAPPRPS